MERYSEYKDSGVKWLGEIPSHWEVFRNKDIFHECKKSVGKNSNNYTLLSLSKKGVVIRNMDDGGKFPAEFDTYKVVEPGDFIFCFFDVDETPRAVGLSSEYGMITGAYTVLRQSIANSQYLYYYYLSIDDAKALKPLYTGLRKTVPLNAFMSMQIFLPPKAEQDAIVRYLDSATSEIDKAIAMQQKMIDLLNERKQIIIQNAVTKGLDENVEMKESGCKILGKIPTTWNVCKTLYILSMPITDGPHTTPQFYSDGIPFVSAEAVSCGNGYIDFTHIRGYISDTFYDECCKKYIPQINDIYMIKSGATTGKVAIVDTNTKFTIWSPLAVFRANRNKVLPDFLYYSLQSQYYQLQVQDKWSFGTKQNIVMRTLEKLIVCYPSIDEQSKIIEYIKNKVLKLDTAIANCQRQITLLQERKQIIINEVVTGKVRVS